MSALGDILQFLVTTYRDRGFTVVLSSRPGAVAQPGFVGDIVLANMHFKLGFRVDRVRLRDTMNEQRGPFVASFEPLVHDVSVSIKHIDDAPLPNNGAVYPRWYVDQARWGMVTHQEAMHLVPHAAIRTQRRVHTFRVFTTGSVVQVGRCRRGARALAPRPCGHRRCM